MPVSWWRQFEERVTDLPLKSPSLQAPQYRPPSPSICQISPSLLVAEFDSSSALDNQHPSFFTQAHIGRSQGIEDTLRGLVDALDINLNALDFMRALNTGVGD
jgi:hypothetical protein